MWKRSVTECGYLPNICLIFVLLKRQRGLFATVWIPIMWCCEPDIVQEIAHHWWFITYSNHIFFSHCYLFSRLPRCVTWFCNNQRNQSNIINCHTAPVIWSALWNQNFPIPLLICKYALLNQSNIFLYLCWYCWNVNMDHCLFVKQSKFSYTYTLLDL